MLSALGRVSPHLVPCCEPICQQRRLFCRQKSGKMLKNTMTVKQQELAFLNEAPSSSQFWSSTAFVRTSRLRNDYRPRTLDRDRSLTRSAATATCLRPAARILSLHRYVIHSVNAGPEQRALQHGVQLRN